MRRPLSRASRAMWLRVAVTSRFAWAMSGQISVPISTTDWCSSGFMRSLRTAFPCSKISAMWERSSRVFGSMTWNSSSIPMLKEGRCGISPSPGGRAGRLKAARPVAGQLQRAGLERPVDEELGGVADDPGEVVRADREGVAVGGRVHEIDGVRHAVPHRELDRVEVVPERAAQRQTVALDAREKRRLRRRRV